MHFPPVGKFLTAMANSVTGDIRMPRNVFVLFCTLGRKKTDRNLSSPDVWALGEPKLVVPALALGCSRAPERCRVYCITVPITPYSTLRVDTSGLEINNLDDLEIASRRVRALCIQVLWARSPVARCLGEASLGSDGTGSFRPHNLHHQVTIRHS